MNGKWSQLLSLHQDVTRNRLSRDVSPNISTITHLKVTARERLTVESTSPKIVRRQAFIWFAFSLAQNCSVTAGFDILFTLSMVGSALVHPCVNSIFYFFKCLQFIYFSMNLRWLITCFQRSTVQIHNCRKIVEFHSEAIEHGIIWLPAKETMPTVSLCCVSFMLDRLDSCI